MFKEGGCKFRPLFVATAQIDVCEVISGSLPLPRHSGIYCVLAGRMSMNIYLTERGRQMGMDLKTAEAILKKAVSKSEGWIYAWRSQLRLRASLCCFKRWIILGPMRKLSQAKALTVKLMNDTDKFSYLVTKNTIFCLISVTKNLFH